ncbi:unnamed protein product, partial [marine sediment metagenome]
ESLGRSRRVVSDPEEAERLTNLLHETDEQMRALKRALSDQSTEVVLAVRSSPIISMPGVLATELHVHTPSDLDSAIRQVRGSWNSRKAKKFRKDNNISDETGMAIIAQRMVRGVINCSGVACSRNPNTGEKGLSGTINLEGGGWLIRDGGDYKGIYSISRLKKKLPHQYKELKMALVGLEEGCGYPQEVEFIIVDGVLYFLQTHDVVFTPQGELRYLKDVVKEGTADEIQALPKLEALQQKIAKRKTFKIKDGVKKKIIGKGVTSISGAMAGRVAFSVEKAREYLKKGPVILISIPSTRDEIMMNISSFPAVGLITVGYGNASSHEAVLTRLAGIPAIINMKNMEYWLLYRELRRLEKRIIKEGDFVVIDGDNNEVFITDNKDVLVEDRSIFDASFGIDINEYRKRFTEPYLGKDGKVKARITYKQLLEANLKAWEKYKRLSEASDKREAFIANLEKHFLHELLIRKAEQKGKDKREVEKGEFRP